MKTFFVNALALAAVLAGGLALSATSYAKDGAHIETETSKCGSCQCDEGQKCRTRFGLCECY